MTKNVPVHIAQGLFWLVTYFVALMLTVALCKENGNRSSPAAVPCIFGDKRPESSDYSLLYRLVLFQKTLKHRHFQYNTLSRMVDNSAQKISIMILSYLLEMHNHELQSYTKNFCGKLTRRECCRTMASARAGRADRKNSFCLSKSSRKSFSDDLLIGKLMPCEPCRCGG